MSTVPDQAAGFGGPSAKLVGAARLNNANRLFRGATFAAAVLVLLTFVGMFVVLFEGAWPAISHFGPGFFVTEVWNPVKERFGILAPITGTLITAPLAMLAAIPLGIGVAIFLTELCPRMLRRPIGIAIELLAGIPSIIYGIWGLFVFAPFFQEYVQPSIIGLFEGVPVLSTLFAGPPFGIGMFTASLILAIMVLPLIASITRDVFETVPPMLKEAAYGLGCTKWEVIWNVVIPYTRTGVVGAGMLAFGRALGETMAVTFVIGNSHHISSSLFAPGTTISATIANEFSEASEPLYVSSLLAAGFFLFIITFVVLAGAQLMLNRLSKQQGH